MRANKIMKFKILNTAIKLRALQGPALLSAILSRISLARDLYQMDIEAGVYTAIPEDLSQSNFPFIMRYYDPIIAYIQEGVGTDIRMRSILINRAALDKFYEYNEAAIWLE